VQISELGLKLAAAKRAGRSHFFRASVVPSLLGLCILGLGACGMTLTTVHDPAIRRFAILAIAIGVQVLMLAAPPTHLQLVRILATAMSFMNLALCAGAVIDTVRGQWNDVFAAPCDTRVLLTWSFGLTLASRAMAHACAFIGITHTLLGTF